MKGTPAVYLGRIVDKTHFRTNVYDSKGKKKLVESWAAYEAAMQSGLWFATFEEAMDSLVSSEQEVHVMTVGQLPDQLHEKPIRKRAPKSKVVKIKEEAEISHDELDEMVFEVKDNE